MNTQTILRDVQRRQAAIMIQKYARRLIVYQTIELYQTIDFNLSASQMWPEASSAMLRRDFKAAARGYREAYEKSRGWHKDDSVPFTPHQQLLLELILQAEVWAMNEVH